MWRNKVVPFVAGFVKTDSFGEAFPVVLSESPADLVFFFDHTCENYKSGLCDSCSGSLTSILNSQKRGTAPGTGDVRKELVFDWVIFGAVWGIVHHYDAYSESFRKVHEVLLHDVVRAGIGAAPVTEYHKILGFLIYDREVLFPESLNVVAHKLGSVVACPYRYESNVVQDVEYAVRRCLADSVCDVVMVEASRDAIGEYFARAS